MPQVLRIAHVAVVTDDLEAALRFWRDGLGLPLEGVRDAPHEGVRVAFLPVGDSEIEAVLPVDPESGVARYLQKRGPGMHHICLEVDDLEGMLAHLQAQGVELIHDRPQTSPTGRRYAFIHPRSAGGVLVELYEATEQ